MNIPLPNKKSASTDSTNTAASINPSVSRINGNSIPDIMSEDPDPSDQYTNGARSLHREDTPLSLNQQLDQAAKEHANSRGDNTHLVSERAKAIFQRNHQGVEERLSAQKEAKDEELRIYKGQLNEHESVVSKEPINIPNEDKELSKAFKISRGISYAIIYAGLSIEIYATASIIARFGAFDCDTILKAAAFPVLGIFFSHVLKFSEPMLAQSTKRKLRKAAFIISLVTIFTWAYSFSYGIGSEASGDAASFVTEEDASSSEEHSSIWAMVLFFSSILLSVFGTFIASCGIKALADKVRGMIPNPVHLASSNAINVLLPQTSHLRTELGDIKAEYKKLEQEEAEAVGYTVSRYRHHNATRR